MRRNRFKELHNLGDEIHTENGSHYKVINFKVEKRMNHKDDRRILKYQLKCMKCGYEFWIRSTDIKKRKCYCEYNTRPRLVPGINDIPTVAPWMIKYFPGGYDEAKKYSVKSNKKVVLKCPYCGKLTRPMHIYDLESNNGIHCVCNDNISYPEKFLSSVLNQLSVEYIFQVGSSMFEFLDKNYRYDFYLPDYNCIIETHGEQHYSDNNFYSKLRDQRSNDLAKEKLAIENGIGYIVLDCRNSNREWIKNSIEKSILPSLLSFSIDDIDWLKCEEYCTSNITKEICNYYMSTMASTITIAKEMNYGHQFIKNNLMKGNDLGWCVYKSSKAHPKPIKLYNDNETMYFKGVMDFREKAKEIFGKYAETETVKKYKDQNKLYKGYYIETVTDPKEKFIAIYGDEAVKWFEEHPEFNN